MSNKIAEQKDKFGLRDCAIVNVIPDRFEYRHQGFMINIVFYIVTKGFNCHGMGGTIVKMNVGYYQEIFFWW